MGGVQGRDQCIPNLVRDKADLVAFIAKVLLAAAFATQGAVDNDVREAGYYVAGTAAAKEASPLIVS
jgi:hypothetical protein